MLIKLVFPSLRSNTNQEVCRIHYRRSSKSLNMNWIAKAIFQITNLKRDTLFSLYYYDNKKFIPITTKSCFENMIKMFINNGQICRIYAIPHLYSDSKPMNSFFSYCRADELPNILLQSPTIVQKSINDTWLQISCKLCEKSNWSGERYTCLFCSNIVLCKECFNTGYHNEHPILCTRNTKLFSQKLLQFSRLAVATVPWKNVLPKVNKDLRIDEQIHQAITASINMIQDEVRDYTIQEDNINNKKRNNRLTLL
ncbi:hypothetical protein EWB00_010630 [Schistosoma japonicum]|uniref:SJCHGC09048 protein n=1 Tax=Schistosoma japonicum TaxID=6182 RepID=Q5D8S2_SCHJA|nr:SJCHGC09048 protein [Schistosoma japonicum]QBA82967.1 zinc finger protein [Schistosoma japonicum]TNN17904.1 hypothetical protein EWB00_010630 [Schistosoma japonicum]